MGNVLPTQNQITLPSMRKGCDPRVKPCASEPQIGAILGCPPRVAETRIRRNPDRQHPPSRQEGRSFGGAHPARGAKVRCAGSLAVHYISGDGLCRALYSSTSAGMSAPSEYSSSFLVKNLCHQSTTGGRNPEHGIHSSHPRKLHRDSSKSAGTHILLAYNSGRNGWFVAIYQSHPDHQGLVCALTCPP